MKPIPIKPIPIYHESIPIHHHYDNELFLCLNPDINKDEVYSTYDDCHYTDIDCGKHFRWKYVRESLCIGLFFTITFYNPVSWLMVAVTDMGFYRAETKKELKSVTRYHELMK